MSERLEQVREAAEKAEREGLATGYSSLVSLDTDTALWMVQRIAALEAEVDRERALSRRLARYVALMDSQKTDDEWLAYFAPALDGKERG